MTAQPRLFYAMIQAKHRLAVPSRGKKPRTPGKINQIIAEELSPCFDAIGLALQQPRWSRFPNRDKTFALWRIAYPLGATLPKGGFLNLFIAGKTTLFLVLEYGGAAPTTVYLPVTRAHVPETMALMIAQGAEAAHLLPPARPEILPDTRACHDVLREIPGWRKLSAAQMVSHIRRAYPSHPFNLAQECVRALFAAKSRRLHFKHTGVAQPGMAENNV